EYDKGCRTVARQVSYLPTREPPLLRLCVGQHHDAALLAHALQGSADRFLVGAELRGEVFGRRRAGVEGNANALAQAGARDSVRRRGAQIEGVDGDGALGRDETQAERLEPARKIVRLGAG